MQIHNYLNERVENQLNFFEKKSALNKKYYQYAKISQLVAAALLPFFSIFISEFGWTKYLVALLGTLVTILEGVLAIGKYHEKWVTYRTTAENLRQEKFLFLMKAGSYADEGAEQQFVNKIELILGKENIGWQQMIIQDQNKGSANGDKNKPNSSSSSAAGRPGAPAAHTGNSKSSPIDPLIGVKNDTEDLKETEIYKRNG